MQFVEFTPSGFFSIQNRDGKGFESKIMVLLEDGIYCSSVLISSTERCLLIYGMTISIETYPKRQQCWKTILSYIEGIANEKNLIVLIQDPFQSCISILHEEGYRPYGDNLFGKDSLKEREREKDTDFLTDD